MAETTATQDPYPCGCGHPQSTHRDLVKHDGTWSGACNLCDCSFFRGMHLFPPVDQLMQQLSAAYAELDELRALVEQQKTILIDQARDNIALRGEGSHMESLDQ